MKIILKNNFNHTLKQFVIDLRAPNTSSYFSNFCSKQIRRPCWDKREDRLLPGLIHLVHKGPEIQI